MIFHHIQESYNQLIIFNSNDVIQILLDIWEDFLARCLYCSTVCNGIYMGKSHHLSLSQGSLHAGCSCRFHTDHLNVWIEKLCQSGDTCCQTAASDRNQDIVHKRKLLDNFHGNGTLTCGNCRIIKRMDKGITLFLSQFQGMGAGLIIYITVKDYLCAIAFGSLNLDQRSSGRHDDHCLHSVFMCRISHTLGMVSCGCCDQSLISLFFRKSADLIISATNLVCSCALHILRFEVNLIAGQIAEITAFDQFCFLCHLFYNLCCLFKAF